MFAAWGCRHNVCPSAGAGSGPILSSPGQFTATTQPGPPRGHQALAKRDADAPFREYGLRRVTSRFRCTILAVANAHAHRPHGAAPDRLKPLVSELLDAECSEALLVALGAGPPRRGEPARRPETLSAPEVEVLALVAQGLNYGGRPGISRKRDTASPAVPLLPVIGITPWCFSEILQPGTERKRKSPPARAAKGGKQAPARRFRLLSGWFGALLGEFGPLNVPSRPSSRAVPATRRVCFSSSFRGGPQRNRETPRLGADSLMAGIS